jgi:Ca2+-binding RTX toxin-like protein
VHNSIKLSPESASCHSARRVQLFCKSFNNFADARSAEGIMFENLEPRRMLAGVTQSYKDGLLTIKGGSKVDQITVTENNGSVHVEVTSQTTGAITSTDWSGVTGINFTSGGSGDMLFYTGNSVGAVINGDKGNDFITVADIGTGSSYVNAGGGDDTVVLIVGHGTTIHGGSGNDLIYVNTDAGSSYATDSAQVVVFGDKGNDTITLYDGVVTVNGGGGTDTIIDVGASTAYTSTSVEQTYTITP